MSEAQRLELAERVRAECLRAALEAYEDGGISGLCQEGRWELAVQVIRTLDVSALVARGPGGAEGGDSGSSGR